MNDSDDVPFELVVERLCRRYHKLPYEILEMGRGWIDIFNAISAMDAENSAKRKALNQVNKRVKNK